MSTSSYRRLPPEGGTPRQIAERINGLLEGRLNIGGSVTLAANAASTTVTDPRASGASRIMLFPRTANAAAEVGNGTIYISANAKGSFTLTHANNAQTDRIFDYLSVG